MVTALAQLPLRQESTLEVDGRDVVISTEFVSDPEAMLVTVVMRDKAIVRKSHVALPAADLEVFRLHGRERLLPSLHAHHLRALRELLSGDADTGKTHTATSARAGVLGSLLVVRSGEVRERVGEDQVPGGWLRAAYLVAGLGDVLADKLALGRPKAARLVGKRIAAVLTPEQGETRVTFVDPDALSADSCRDLGLEHRR
jgi:hypothetical protein